ncbi:hypothetical protein Tsubulata_014471 [Turnera subulata]|uniref:Pentacotripeptide-repeat region of PRORP domain-containing protein n=1 Tax=Turnera subulata TaxID=218843 RepID=A0A9Q0GNC8_9ROSI|nr:hypothetical protein Tsubulata_014471 [Turnera subulata]
MMIRRCLVRFRSLSTVPLPIPKIQQNPGTNLFQCNQKIVELGKLGRVEEARILFDEMPQRDSFSWNSMISIYIRGGDIKEAKFLFDSARGYKNVRTWTTLLSGRSGMTPDQAVLVVGLSAVTGLNNLDLLSCLRCLVLKTGHEGQVVVGTAILNAYTRCGSLDDANGNGTEGLKFFVEFHRTGMIPSQSSFTSSLCASAHNAAVEIGRQLHSLAIKTRCQSNLYVGNGLISMYAKCNKLDDVSRVFNSMRVKDTASWNTLISGLSENCMLDDAQNAFDKMETRDAVSWSAIISAYVQAGKGKTALQMFLDMLSNGVKPAELTFPSLLSACGTLVTTSLEICADFIHLMKFVAKITQRKSIIWEGNQFGTSKMVLVLLGINSYISHLWL